MESLPFSRKALVLSFLWQSADARVDARCCKLGHVQLLLSAVMEKGSGYMGQVSGGQSDRAAGKKVLGGCGGVLVAALLVFTVALLVRGRGAGNGRLPLKLSHVQSQTNGGPSPTPKSHPPRSPPPRPQRSCSLDLGDTGGCYGYARRLGGAWARRSHSVHGGLLGAGCRGLGGSAERLEESVV